MDQIVEFTVNYPLLVAGTLLTAIVVLVFELRLRSSATFEVSVIQAVRMINKGAAVVDVRGAEQFAAGHVVDAVNIDAATLARGETGKIKKKRAIVVVCDDGRQSQRCARQLQQAGFEGAFSLAGGLAAWKRENQLLVNKR